VSAPKASRRPCGHVALRGCLECVRQGFREAEHRHVDDLAEARGTLEGMLEVLAFYMALRRHESSALGALERVMDEIVAFDERCEAGDVAGAAAALREWFARTCQ
jgi:hypothetical protein